MIRTTFYKLKKACYTLTLAPRVLLRGEAMKYTPGKFQKLSITVLKTAEKSTSSGSDKDEECEKCKKLIELIFGPSKPEPIQGLHKTEIPETDIHQINEARKEKLAEIITPQVHETNAHTELNDRVIAENFIKDNKKVLADRDRPIETHLHATGAKKEDEQLIQKLEVINETPVVEAEIPKGEGLNAPPKVLGTVEEIQSYQKYENSKWEELDNIRIHSVSKPEVAEETTKMRDTIENLVHKIEESHRLEDLRKQEETLRIERVLSKEIERSDFKLPIYNFASDRQNRNKSGAAETNYDELAKRCLDAPNSKIDERLLKEMEKLGVPQTNARGETSVIEENIIQIDMKKPRKPAQKTEIDLETREFERDPPIAYIDRLHPAFEMANNPKDISDEDSKIENLTSDRIHTYELEKKPLTYSEATQEECVNFESAPYDTSRVIIDPYDKKTIAFEDDGEEYDPLWYERYTIRQEKELNSDKDKTFEAAAAFTTASTPYQTFDCSRSEAIPESEDQYKPVTSPYVSVDTDPLDPLDNKSDAPFYQSRESMQLSFKPEHVAAVTAETNLKEGEVIQLSVVIDPNEAGRVSSAQQFSNEYYKDSSEPEHSSIEHTIKPEKYIEPEAVSNKFEKVSVEPEKSSVTFGGASIEPSKDIEPAVVSTQVENTFMKSDKAPEYQRASMEPEKDVESEEVLMKFEPEKSIEPERTSNESERAATAQDKVLEENTAPHESKVFQYYSNDQHSQIIEPNVATESQNHEQNAHRENVLYNPINSSSYTPTEMNTPKHSNETYQYERPNLYCSEEIKSQNFNYKNSETEMPESNVEQSKPFQYSIPPETTLNDKQDVTYIEPKAPEDSLQKTENKPNLTTEEISHSFVQPKAMVNPLGENQNVAKPSEKIQTTMSASACSLPNLKPTEELSLSEMLKRVRMRNRLEYCQAFDRKLGQLSQVDPVTGKCGKKTPPCPPPAPKCPQCPPPACPPAPPPCPKPCKPACPPPCPPPCPAKKDPCSKFQKHFPDLQNIITLLLQPSVLEKSESLNLYVRVSESSLVVLLREICLKLQEIGMKLFITYPKRICNLSNFGETITLARDYEPWVPIPSWPIPKKEIKRPLVCPKEGCKLIPPPKLRPPCNENPCINFPKRSNSFSIPEVFGLYVGTM